MSLKAESAELRERSKDALPAEARETLNAATQRLVASGIAEKALGVGEVFPRFSLPNVVGSAVNSADLLQTGPLVVSFYRGGWCPYCNLELRAYQAMLDDIRQIGADFVAISPQLPDESLSMAAKTGLTFEVLCDMGNSLSEHLGLMFELPESVIDLYRSFGFDLERINGNMQWTLPVPATYVVDMDGKIAQAHVNADHSIRQEPEDVMACLRSLQE